MKRIMRRFKEMPKSGQFIRVWVYQGVTWSYTLRWSDDNTLEMYDVLSDSWIREDESPRFNTETECEYLVPNW